MAHNQPPILKAKIRDRPALRDLSNFVVPHVSHKWYNLGLQLFDTRDEGILKSMKAEISKSPEEHCLEVFNHWLDTKKNPTWKKLIKSLRYHGVNLPSVASNIEKMLAPGAWRKVKNFIGASHGGAKTLPKCTQPQQMSHDQHEESSMFYVTLEDSSGSDESDGDEAETSYIQHSPFIPRTTSMQHLNLTTNPTRKRSAIRENQFRFDMRSSSLSEGLNQMNNKDSVHNWQEIKAQTPVPKPRTRKSVSPVTTPGVMEGCQTSHISLSAKTSENIPSDFSGNLAEIKDKYTSLEASYENEHKKLQQQVDALEKKLTDTQKQKNGSTKSSSTVEDTEFLTLINSLRKNIKELQELLNRLQNSNKKIISDIENEQSILSKHVSDIEKGQNTLSKRVSDIEKGHGILSERNTEYEKNITALQKDINELTQQKSGYAHNEGDTYKIIETERKRAAEVEKALKQKSVELQEKIKETLALKERQHELESTVQKLENGLRVSKNEHNSKIAEYTKEIQQYESLYAAEKENTVKIQKTLTQLSAELQEKTEEAVIVKKNQDELQLTVKKLEDALRKSKSGNNSTELLSLKENYQRLLHEKQSIEKQLQDTSKQYDLRIKETEDNNKRLQAEKKNAIKNKSALQNTNSLLIQQNEYLESAVKTLQAENNMLKLANKEQDGQLLENSEKHDENDMLKIANKEQDRQLPENFENQAHGDQEVAVKALTVSKEQYCTLEERFHETLNEKQNEELATRDLQNASEQSQSEVENQKLKAENLEELQQLNELPSPVDQNYKSNVTSASEKSSADQIKGGEDEDTEVFEPKETPLKDPPVNISLTAAKERSSETTINPDNITEHKFTVTIVKKNPAESSTELPTENQSTEVLSKTQSMEHHATRIPSSSCDYQKSPQSGQPADSKKDATKGPSPTFLAQKPQMWRLGRNVVPQIMAHWQDVAYHLLHYDVSTVTAIKKRCASDPKRCCLELFQDWLTTANGVGHKTWETLLTQLKKVEGLADTVEEIKKSFKSL